MGSALRPETDERFRRFVFRRYIVGLSRYCWPFSRVSSGLFTRAPDRLNTQPPPELPTILIIVMGVVARWCAGTYFAYRTARAANEMLRAIGSMEMLVFLLRAAVSL